MILHIYPESILFKPIIARHKLSPVVLHVVREERKCFGPTPHFCQHNTTVKLPKPTVGRRLVSTIFEIRATSADYG